VETDKEVNPKLEMTAIQKLLDGGPPILFNKVKGYTNARLATNVMASDRIIAKMFGLKDRKASSSRSTRASFSPSRPRSWTRRPARKS